MTSHTRTTLSLGVGYYEINVTHLDSHENSCPENFSVMPKTLAKASAFILKIPRSSFYDSYILARRRIYVEIVKRHEMSGFCTYFCLGRETRAIIPITRRIWDSLPWHWLRQMQDLNQSWFWDLCKRWLENWLELLSNWRQTDLL